MIFYKALDQSKNKIKSIVYSLYSVPPTGSMLGLDMHFFTPSQRSKTQRRYILSLEIQNYNAPVNWWWWEKFPQCTENHIWGTGINSGNHIYAPLQEYQCTGAGGILQALGPSNILVVFYCLLLCHRQYMICGVCSLVNNSTLCWCACSPLGWSYMEHCQH